MNYSQIEKDLFIESCIKERPKSSYTSSPIIDESFLGSRRIDIELRSEKIIRYCQTSGSTGEPKLIPYSRIDVENAVVAQVRAYILGGVKPRECQLCVMAYGPWPSGLICQQAGEVIGTTIPADPKLGIDWQVDAISKFQPSYMTCIPSFLPRLEKRYKELGIPLASSSIRKVFLVGECFSEDFRSYYQDLFNVKIFNMYANTEFGVIASECSHQKLHVLDDLFNVEIVDLKSQKTLPAESVGEVVISSLKKEALPLIRYNTHDLSSLSSEVCDCGSHFPILNSIKGRSDDIFTVSGVNVYPNKIEAALGHIEGLSSFYQFIVTKENNSDSIKIKIEAKDRKTVKEASFFETRVLERLVQEEPYLKLAFYDWGLIPLPEIEILSPGALSSSSWKVKKIQDLRS